MKRIHSAVKAPALALLLASLGLVGCGDDGGPVTTCGEGTVLMGTMCVPDGPDIECGTGTVLMGGECVPDGSVICEQGTVFDPVSGQCEVDDSACAPGTVLIGGQCVPEDDTLTADIDEAAEPNDMAGAGQFTVPAVGSMTTIHGCITPRAGVRDEDVWIMQAAGPTAIEITADGVGGLAAGFIVQDAAIPSLPTYFRAGINLVGDTSRRQVFLPTAGTYLLVMDDSRAILVDEVAGNADTCYYATIEGIALPAATALTVPTEMGTDSGDIRVLSYTADANGDILRTVLTSGSPSLSPAFVVMRGDTLVASTGPVAATQTTAAIAPQWTEGGMNANDVITIVVDHQYNFSPNGAPYTFASLDLSSQALPTDGSMVTVTGRRPGTGGFTDLNMLSYLYFDVTGNGTIVQWNLTSSIALDMFVVRKNLLTNTTFQVHAIYDAPGGAGRTTFNNEFTRYLAPGRYYLVVQNPATTAAIGETYTITSTLTPVTPSALTYDTPATAQALPASGVAFHTIDLNNPSWIEVAATGTSWGAGNVRVSAFDPAGEGWVGVNYVAAFTGDQPAAGTAPYGRITHGDTRDFIVRVSSTMAPGAGATYDLEIRDRPHTAVSVMPGAPVTRTAEPLTGPSNSATSQTVTRYLVTGPAFGGLSAVVTPAATADPILRRRGLNEESTQSFDVGLNGGAETLIGSFGNTPGNYIAFTVGDFNTGATTFDVTFTATAPAYTVTSATFPYVDACAGGTVVATGLDDTLSGTIALPAAFATFPLFGTATAGQIKISSNGWITFDTAVTSSLGGNTAYPNAAAPNALVSPYAEDLAGVTICTRANAAGDQFTVQWTGFIYNTPAEVAQVQAVLHATGRIDFIYGSGHTLNGSEIETGGTTGATVGVENQAGTAAVQILFNQNGIMPATSRTLTPNP